MAMLATPLRVVVATALCSFASWCDTAPLFTRGLGGGASDGITAMTLDPAGRIVVAGYAFSPNLEVTNGSRNPGTNLSVSLDHGATWGPLSNLPSGTASALVFSSGDFNLIWAGSSGGVFRSIDGGATWAATGITSQVISLAADPVHSLGVYAGTSEGIFRSLDGGVTWKNITANFPKPADVYQPLYISPDPFHPGTVYAGTNLIDARTFDGGATWSAYALPGAETAVHAGPVFDPLRASVIYVGTRLGLLRSQDNGQTWRVLDVPALQPQTVALLPSAPDNVWVVEFDGRIYRSTDGGTSFRKIQDIDNQRYFGMAVDPFQTSTILTFDYRTSDGGGSWQPMKLGRSGTYVFDPGTPGRVIAMAAPTSDAFVAKLDADGSKIVFASYLGGIANDGATGVAADRDGNIYVIGTADSQDFPNTLAEAALPFVSSGGASPSFAAKFDAQGNLLYSIPLPIAFPRGIAVDSNGNLLVSGRDCVIVKLTPDGRSTVFSTRIENATACNALAVDARGYAVVAGLAPSNAFRPTADGLQTAYRGVGDVALVRLDPAGAIVYATFLGGTGDDVASALTLDPDGDIYLTGSTSSPDFPVTDGAYRTRLSTNCPYPTSYTSAGLIGTIPSYRTANVFITKLDPTGRTMMYSTYLGGNCLDGSTSIAADRLGNVWVSGYSDSSNFPQIWPVDAPPRYSESKAFIVRLAESGAWVWRSSFAAVGSAVATDDEGNAYVGGAGTMLWKVGPQ